MPAFLRTLGPSPGLQVSADVEASLPAGKPYAVLCLVALEPGGILRDDLCTMLWADSAPDRARASVRQALHVLRKALGPDAIEDVGDALALRPGALRVDLTLLEEALESEDLEAAHRLWQGGPFAQVSLAGSHAFNEWADRIRSRYERRLSEGLLSRAELAAAERGPEEALVWLGRALDVRSWDEGAHLRRIETLLELNYFDEAETALGEALVSVDDPSETVFGDLRERILRLRRARILEAEHTADHPGLEFVGRTGEMAELRRLLHAVVGGRPRAVAILGPAGIGKTRLAEEFLRASLPENASVARAKAVATDRQIELGMVADLIRDLVGRAGAAGISNASHAVLQQIVPSMANGTPDHYVGMPTEAGLADALLDLVEAVAHEAPLALLVDDLQWADPASRTLLLRVLRSLRALPVLTLITCRSGDADLSALRVLREEVRAGRVSALELAPLSSREVREFLALSVPVRPDAQLDRVAEKIYATTRGNPLFLTELVRQLGATGVVVRGEGGSWVLDAGRLPRDLPLPASVRQVLEDRFGHLSEDARRLARMLASATGALAPSELAGRTGLPVPATTTALGELLRQGIVTWAEGDTLRFSHDTLRETAFALLGPAPSRGTTWRQRWPMVLGAAALVALAAAGWIWTLRDSQPTGPPLYGGGVIQSVGGPVVHRIRPPRATDGPWDSLPPVLLDGRARSAYLSWEPDGSPVVYGVVPTDDGVPMSVQFTETGAWRVLLPRRTDVNLTDVSPDGHYALLLVGDDSGPSWRLRVVRYDLLTGDTLTVHEPPSLGSASWFLDGSALVAQTFARPDTLILMRPDGTRIRTHTLPPSSVRRQTAPCGGPGHRVLVESFPPGGLATPSLIDLDTDVARDLTFGLPVLGISLACSPDGRALAYVAEVENEPHLVVQDRDDGSLLIGPPWDPELRLRWIPDGPPPLPAELRVHPRNLAMRWGDEGQVEAEVLTRTGQELEDSLVQWTSLAPTVVYVTRHGQVFANREGTAKLVASVQGWITDTTVARVMGGGTPRDALFSDRFRTLDDALWQTFGSPRPKMVQDSSGPVLDLNGDGVGSDGLASREVFDLSRGGTLELSYRLPLTRKDRQAIRVCLTPWTKGPDADRQLGHARGLCFQHPLGELAEFDSTSFVFDWSLLPTGRLSRPDLFPSDEWQHVAIVLAPDGNARLLVNGEEAADLPRPIRIEPGTRWRIQLLGRAADTRLLVRDVILWPGMRY